MPRCLCLTRQCLGLMTRIECVIRPVSGEEGTWMLLFAAGMSGEHPSAIRSQGPFNSLDAAQSMLENIAESLTSSGYLFAEDVPIWMLHMRAELRRISKSRPGYKRSSPF